MSSRVSTTKTNQNGNGSDGVFTTPSNITIGIFMVFLFGFGSLTLIMGSAFPDFQIFWITVSLGVFIVLAISAVSYFFIASQYEDEAKKQAKNIVPGYCPDYWTKGFDLTGKVVCKNGFTGKTHDGKTITYKFVNPDTKVPEAIALDDLANSTNTHKCNMYSNPIRFAAPWLEMRSKCDLVTF
jgi:hypothetical protein